MSATALEVRVHQQRKRVELNRFTESLEQIVTALREIDQVANSDSQRAVWVIEDLDYSNSYLSVRLTVRVDATLRRTEESLYLPIDALVDGVRQLTVTSEIPRYYSEPTVDRLVRAGEPKRGVEDISLAAINGSVGEYVGLSGEFRRNAADAVREYSSSTSALTGQLHLIAQGRRTAGRDNSRVRLTLIDPLTQRAISGSAPASMADTLRDLWGHRVLVDGQVKRNRHGQAVSISASSVFPMPDDDDARPDVDTLLGIAPDWTGTQSVDDFVAEMRRA